MINIKGLDKGAVLAALHNGTRPQGMGFLNARDDDMTADEANVYLARSPYVDYCAGRPIKVSFASDEIDPRLYDRDAGQGVAESIISRLREQLNVPA